MAASDRSNSKFLPSKGRLTLWALLLGLVGLAAPRIGRENFFSEGGATEEAVALPAFPRRTESGGESPWIGTEPLDLEGMGGRVWVLKVWAFECINCLRSIAYTNGLVERFGAELGVLGIHAPEYESERDREELAATLARHDVQYPNYVDESLDYFFALEAPAWPAFYVVDRAGRIRGRWVGEMHAGTFRARALEGLISELLAEPAD